MAEIHRTTLEPTKLELLTGWLPTRRWYAGKSGSGEPVTPELRHVGGYRLDDPSGEVGIEVLLVEDSSGPAPVLYQVPLTYRGSALEGEAADLVGTTQHGVLGTRWVYDGTADPAFAGAFVDLLVGRARAQHRRLSDTEEPHVTATALGPARHIHLASHEVLTGEQSNTSLLCRLVDSDGTELAPIMVKVFRVLSPGENPDVVLPAALSAAGSPNVPLVFGYVASTGLPGVIEEAAEPVDDGTGDDAGPAGGGATDEPVYHLAFAQELLTPAEDARRVAVRLAAAGVSFAEEAGELGLATAGIHRTLAATTGTRPPSADDRFRIVAELRSRAATALAEVPGLGDREDVAAEVSSTLDAVAALPAERWPDLQRIHGDYHLGQVLRSASGTWAVIDFEGEPLRPLSERVLPDLPLRDVAGMLRSFDYAGGSARVDGADPEAVRTWVAEAQEAFLAGYAEGLRTDPGAGAGDVADHDADDGGELLRALLLDKALYEAVYESRNRPDWLSIPLTAIDHLLDGPDRGGETHHNGDTDDDVPTTDERS
ncbi:trehalose synthase-fused probable maltokinase [Salana multivorans]|uniref:Maltokinase n=1 Tax=Salana multivorans TaxID=120377 RepID=A0A3N2D780_9MICO|nr:aminoglycoside phosphotransferase [Salana multivorans]ROR95633.1 trehalose synthase-fused probable maltokinase [Salana multivorans]